MNLANEISTYLSKKLPRIIGNMAVSHFKENFRKGGFVDNGVQKWKDPQRLNTDGDSASQKYGTLTSSTNELMNSITYSTSGSDIKITSDKEYAQIHNDGGIIDIPITPKMKKYAWYRHGEATKEDKTKNTLWKGIALTKKTSLKVEMPQRKFVGHSKELDYEVAQKIAKDFDKIFQSLNKK